MDKSYLRNSIAAWLEGTISKEEMAELELLLLENNEAREFYLNQMDIHAELSGVAYADCLFQSVDQSENQDSIDEDSFVDCESIYSYSDNVVSRSKLPPARWLLAIAATLLLATGFWTGLRVSTHDRLTDGRLTDNKIATGREADSITSILGSLEPATPDTQWYIEGASESADVGSVIAGDVLRVTSGRLELTYDNGIEIVLHSPAAFQVLSKMEARMLVGRLTATVSEEGKGFSVITPQATVIDLGTEFGVEVDKDGATDVVVFKGVVDVDYHKDGPDPKNDRRLVMGEAVRLDAVGTTSRIVSVDQRDYYSNSSDLFAGKPIVISNVKDNIKRNAGAMNYYEIVHQGMQEDALAFVDRIAHEWNGIDLKGMPRYLLGADYVKTFNADKYDQDIVVEVELSVPCRLYVIFDDRLQIPSWLSEEFEDTRDNIGLDTGPFYSPNDGKLRNTNSSGVGPGESVEDIFSVWVKEMAEPCVFKLGSTETFQGIAVANMYGIAATPLEAP